MAELKTRPTRSSVKDFVASIKDEGKRKDANIVLALMKKATGETPKMWGPSIVGFGTYHYRSESGREGDWFLTGFSPRAQALTVYILPGFDRYAALMKKLGKYKTGKSCLYIKRLDDVDLKVLQDLVSQSVRHLSRLRA